ncbi:MAG: V-type ATP synthase subunit I [Brevinematia bacterium]
MFFPERMVEINILTVEDYLKEISDYLIKFGEFEVKKVDIKGVENISKLGEKENNEAEIFSKIKLRLDKLAVNMKIDENKIKETLNFREPLSIGEIESRLLKAENEFYSSYSILENLDKEEIELRIRKLKHTIKEEMNIKGVSKEFFVALLVITKYEYDPISKVLSEFPSVIKEIESFGELKVILISLPKSYKNEILKLSTSFIKIINIDEIVNEQDDIKEIDRRLKEIEVEKKKLKSVIEKIIETNTDEIITLYKGLWFINSSMKIKSQSIKGGKFLVFSGWIPKKYEKEIVRKITEITKDTCVIEVNDAEKLAKSRKSIQVPTKLSNPKILHPFESLVKLYSIPRFYEIDPTIIFSFLYVIFYGMMFGDIGQGLVLSLVSFLLFLKFKNFRVISGLGIAVGISAAIFGFLYGSVFGIEGKIIPTMWISPLHDVIEIMKISVIIGFVVILIGLIINVINTVIEKNWLKLVMGSKGIAGLVFYTFLVGYPLYFLIYGGQLNINFMLIGLIVPIIMFTIESIVESKRHGHNVSFASVFFELFEVFISFISNTLSFIRIAGFAINHVALMITFFSIAEVLKGSVIGDILSFVVVVFGQIFIIVFEGLVVGIQALRLSFYEFFTKFFRGGGKIFEPLR